MKNRAGKKIQEKKEDSTKHRKVVVVRQLGEYIKYFLQCGCFESIDMVRKTKENDSCNSESEKTKTLTIHFLTRMTRKLKVFISLKTHHS